jgi:pilus assembly protein Flp/PilA
MLNLYCKFKALLATRDQGMTAVEYALILVGVVAVVATVIFTFGGQIKQIFSNTCTNLRVTC